MDWNKENTLRFIQLIRERPIIWDASSSDNKNKMKKHDAIEEVSKIMGISTKEVNTKWTSLRGQYNREKKKVTGLKTGSGADEIYISKWFAYQEMANLVKFNIPQNSVTNLEYDPIPATPTSPTPPPSSTPTPSLTTPLTTLPTPSPPLPPPYQVPKKRNRNTSLYAEAMSTLKTIKERKTADLNDDITTYGLYIAAQIRKLQPILQSKLKLDIQTLLCKYEIENLDYRSGSSMSDYSDYSPQSPMIWNDSLPSTMPVPAPMQTTDLVTYCSQPESTPLNKVILISKNATNVQTDHIDKPTDQPAVIILKNETVVSPATTSAQDEVESIDDIDRNETREAIEHLLRFNKQ